MLRFMSASYLTFCRVNRVNQFQTKFTRGVALLRIQMLLLTKFLPLFLHTVNLIVMNKLGPSVIAYWNATWQKYQQTGQVSNVYNNWTEFAPVVLADDGQSDFWSVGAWGLGSVIMPVLSDSSDVKMSGDNSLQIIINGANSGYGNWYINHHYEIPLNLSGDDFVSYYWYGANTGKTMSIYMRSPDDANFFKVDFLDNFDGWNRLIFSLPAFSKVGSAEWDHINDVRIVCFDKNVSGIWYLDRVILDVGPLEK
jgi:hypothetical protein